MILFPICPKMRETAVDKTKIKTFISLHLLLAVYSTCGIFSKLAAGQPFLSFRFCFYYGCIIALLGIYAIGWQQLIKQLPLTTAFANKSVTVVWSIVWGAWVFQETVTLGKIIGALLVMAGVAVFATADKEAKNE